MVNTTIYQLKLIHIIKRRAQSELHFQLTFLQQNKMKMNFKSPVHVPVSSAELFKSDCPQKRQQTQRFAPKFQL